MKKSMFRNVIKNVLVFVCGIGIMFVVFRYTSIFEEKTVSNETQVVRTLTQEKQIVLLNIGITDLYDQAKSVEFFGQEVMGTKKSKFLKAEFNAKLGIDGKDVVIKKTGTNNYTITIPKFIFIGHSDIMFELALDDKEIFSIFTNDIQETELVNDILADEAQQVYLDKYDSLIRESAEDFYTSLVRGIDDSITLQFVFEE